MVIHALESRADLNGTTAQVKSYDFPSGRYVIDLDHGKGTMKAKPGNLRPIGTS